eukprot:c4515_g1_i1 orf=774-1997(+)
MFFSGDPSSRRKVDLRGKSSKERDRGKLLEQARIDREKRQRHRLETQSATRIQRCFRGRKAVAAERPTVRSQFCAMFGEYGEKANRNAFSPSSKYLSQLLFFFRTNDIGDYHRLVGVCRLLHQLLSESGDIVTLFTSGDYSQDSAIVEYRVKNLTFLCIQALYHHRGSIKVELSLPAQGQILMSSTAVILLETVLLLTELELPWAGVVIEFLLCRKLFWLLRNLLLSVLEDNHIMIGSSSCIEHAVAVLALRHLQITTRVGAEWGFAVQILSIPLLFQCFPQIRQVCVNEGLWAFSIHELACTLSDLQQLLPLDISPRFPTNVCLLGNILEVAGASLSSHDCSLQLAVQFSVVARTLMEELPEFYFKFSEASDDAFEESMEEDDGGNMVPEQSLEEQLLHAVDFDFS